LVDVEKDDRRESVISDMNVHIGSSKYTLAHEFGHVLGLYDEYDGGFFENIMFWHDNRFISDTPSIMNMGSALRPRHFQHYRDRLQKNAAANCVYSIVSDPSR
jgi:hypothetical protein